MPTLPGGTVTFAFTDIEGSTQLLQELGDVTYARASDDHRRIVRETFAAHGDAEVDTQGDAFFFAFPRARDDAADAGHGGQILPSETTRVLLGEQLPGGACS